MVGIEIKSYCLEFYHSLAKQLLSSKNYRLEPTLAAVPVFELSYDVSLLFNTYCNTSYLHLPPGLDVGTKVWYMQRNIDPYSKYIKARMLSFYISNTSELFAIKCLATSVIHQLPLHILHELDTTASPTNSPFQQYNSLPAWIKNG